MDQNNNNLDALGVRLTQLAVAQEKWHGEHQDFMQGMKEIRASQKETSEQMKKTDAQIKETEVLVKETSEQIKKTDAQIKETEVLVKETSEQMKKTDEQMKKTDEQMKKTDEQMKRTDARLDKLSILFGNSGNIDGEIAEEIFFTSLKNSLKLGNIQFDNISRNIRSIGSNFEFDIVLVNGTTIGLIETKRKAHPNEVRKLSIQQTQRFRETYPQYSKHKVYFGIASLVSNKELIRESKKAGIFLLRQKGNHIEMVNTQVKEF